MENMRKHGDTKLVTTEEKRIKLVSEPNYHTTKHFSKNLLAIEMKKTKSKMNKPVYLGMSILDISKTLMYELWYDYVKPKYKDKAKLCSMDTDSFVINIFTEANKIAPNSNDDKRLQPFDRVTTYSYRTNAFKVCEREMLSKIRCSV